MTSVVGQFGLFIAHVCRRFYGDRGLQVASSLTFTTLLALVPLITIALTIVSVFPFFSGLGEQTRAFLLANMLPESAGKVVAAYLEQFAGRAGRLTAVGTVALAVTAFMLMFTIEGAFNSIWRVSHARPIAQRILIYWSAVTLGPVMIGASLSITSYLVGASLGFARQYPDALAVLFWFVPFALTCAAFTLLYYVVPNRSIRPAHALWGGVVAGLAFEMMKRGFAAYVAALPTYALVYGAFAVIPVFLLWIYFSWVVIVVGALIAALAPDFGLLRRGAQSSASAGFREALGMLLALARAQRGSELLNTGQISKRTLLTGEQVQHLLVRAIACGWVARTVGDRYGLVIDAERLLVADIYRAFFDAGVAVPGAADVAGPILERLSAQADRSLNRSLKQLLDTEADSSPAAA